MLDIGQGMRLLQLQIHWPRGDQFGIMLFDSRTVECESRLVIQKWSISSWHGACFHFSTFFTFEWSWWHVAHLLWIKNSVLKRMHFSHDHSQLFSSFLFFSYQHSWMCLGLGTMVTVYNRVPNCNLSSCMQRRLSFLHATNHTCGAYNSDEWLWYVFGDLINLKGTARLIYQFEAAA